MNGNYKPDLSVGGFYNSEGFCFVNKKLVLLYCRIPILWLNLEGMQ